MDSAFLDTAIKFGAGRYRQGRDVLENCGKEISRFGQKVYIVAGDRAWKAVRERMIPALEAASVAYILEIYSGPCSYEAGAQLAKQCIQYGCDEVVGVGGGVIMDLAKVVGEYAGVGVVNIPTSIATCAAFTTVSIMYTPDGRSKDCWRYDHEIDAVLVDTEVIAHCPGRYAAAGILDAMAKRIEIQNGQSVMRLRENDIDIFCSYKMAEITYDILWEYGEAAVRDIQNHRLTKAVEDITFVNIALTGVIANTTKSYRQSALGHMIYNGIRKYFTEESKDAVHGEIVAVGLFTQLYYNNLAKEKNKLKEFMRKLRMPLSLSELGVEATSDNILVLENYLIDSPYVVRSKESLCRLHEAMKEMLI